MYVLFRFSSFFSMAASGIALPERADQKCMRWMKSESFQSRARWWADPTLGYSVDGQDCNASLTSAAFWIIWVWNLACRSARWGVRVVRLVFCFFPPFTYLLMLFCTQKPSGAQKTESLKNMSSKTQPIISDQINPLNSILMSCLHLVPI